MDIHTAPPRPPARRKANTPAHRIVALLGGPRATARLAGRHVSRVYGWLTPRAEGGTGGHVPLAAQQRLVQARPDVLTLADFAPRAGETFR